MLSGCGTKYAVGYPVHPHGGEPVTYTTPIMIRQFADRRPHNERREPVEARDFRFYSRDIDFKEPVARSITRAFKLELANAGFEVADAKNYIVGDKPHLRISGDIVHFHVSRKAVPIETLQYDVDTLWRRERFTVRVGIRIRVIDALAERVVIQRLYESSDSFIMRTDMIDAADVVDGGAPDDSQWKVADNQFAIDILNEHLKRVLVQARRDLVRLMAPAQRRP